MLQREYLPLQAAGIFKVESWRRQTSFSLSSERITILLPPSSSSDDVVYIHRYSLRVSFADAGSRTEPYLIIEAGPLELAQHLRRMDAEREYPPDYLQCDPHAGGRSERPETLAARALFPLTSMTRGNSSLVISIYRKLLSSLSFTLYGGQCFLIREASRIKASSAVSVSI